MLLKAVHTVMGEETYKPGDIFIINDEDDARHLIETGAATPVRKKVSLNISSRSDTDDMAEDMMNDRRQSTKSDNVISVTK